MCHFRVLVLRGLTADEFDPNSFAFLVADFNVNGAVHILLRLVHSDGESLAGSELSGRIL